AARRTTPSTTRWACGTSTRNGGGAWAGPPTPPAENDLRAASGDRGADLPLLHGARRPRLQGLPRAVRAGLPLQGHRLQPGNPPRHDLARPRPQGHGDAVHQPAAPQQRPLAPHAPRHGVCGGGGGGWREGHLGAAGVPHPARRRRDRAVRGGAPHRHGEAQRRGAQARRAHGARRDPPAGLRLAHSLLMRVQVNARNRAFQFEAAAGEKVLYCGLRAKIGLPYECATGTCGTCKARLLDGRIDDGWPQAPGKKSLKTAQGEFLMCQCTALTDLNLEVASFVYPADPSSPPVGGYAGALEAVRPLTHDVAAFDVALERPCEFEAGQFMALGAPGVPGLRGYSMVNFDRPARRLSFVA